MEKIGEEQTQFPVPQAPDFPLKLRVGFWVNQVIQERDFSCLGREYIAGVDSSLVPLIEIPGKPAAKKEPKVKPFETETQYPIAKHQQAYPFRSRRNYFEHYCKEEGFYFIGDHVTRQYVEDNMLPELSPEGRYCDIGELAIWQRNDTRA